MRWSKAWWSTWLLALLLTGRADSTPRLGPDPEAVLRSPYRGDTLVSGERDPSDAKAQQRLPSSF